MTDKMKAAAKGLFEKNPSLGKLFFTTDGQCFKDDWAANTHQKNDLKGDVKAVITVTPADVADTDDEKEKEKIKARVELNKKMEELKAKKSEAETALAGEDDEAKRMKITSTAAGIDEELNAVEAELKALGE